MKILCVCVGGNVRSVTLARMLRKRGFEAIACGVDSRWSDETILMLFSWADKICIQKDAAEKLEKRMQQKKSTLNPTLRFVGDNKFDFHYDVGKDDWEVPQHHDLVNRYRDLLDLRLPDSNTLTYPEFLALGESDETKAGR